MNTPLPSLSSLRKQLQRREGQVRPLGSPLGKGSDFPDWLRQAAHPPQVSEWIAATPGSGAWQLALAASRPPQSANSRWLFAGTDRDVLPQGWEQCGVNLAQLALVRAADSSQLLWGVEQALRSGGVDVVCCRLPRVPPVVFRRLKLAAEAGRCACVLLRDHQALREMSGADLRVLVSSCSSPSWKRRWLRVEVLKVRNGIPGKGVLMELDDETGALRVVSELADSAAVQRPAGA